MRKLLLIILVIIAAGAIWYFIHDRNEKANEDQFGQATSTPSSSDVGLDDASAVTVGDQDPGTKVLVDLVILSKPGYVAIHESANGQPGRALGHSSLLKADAYTDVSVPMTTTSGVTYIAVLHTDNGDGIFNASTDAPVKDEDGTIIMSEFTVMDLGL
ncbi:MAG: hypothetical protein KW806_02865 [Candidatus Yanofskybacteria bacterium]|nr:hypothetical protein [Candidatus Yanofskybacteria bacterium]